MQKGIISFKTVEREEVERQGINIIPGRILEIVNFLEEHSVEGSAPFKKFLLSLDHDEQEHFDYNLAYYFQLQKLVPESHFFAGNEWKEVPYICLVCQNGLTSSPGRELCLQYVQEEFMLPHGIKQAWLIILFLDDMQQLGDVSFEEVIIETDENTTTPETN